MPCSWCSDHLGGFVSWRRYLWGGTKAGAQCVKRGKKAEAVFVLCCFKILTWSISRKLSPYALLLPVSLLCLPLRESQLAGELGKCLQAQKSTAEYRVVDCSYRGHMWLNSTASWNLETFWNINIYICHYTCKGLCV